MAFRWFRKGLTGRKCKHLAVIPNSLRGKNPSFWPAVGGSTHFEGLCDYCKRDVWRHALPDEDPPWRLSGEACGCANAAASVPPHN